jgi:hypothetical protein
MPLLEKLTYKIQLKLLILVLTAICYLPTKAQQPVANFHNLPDSVINNPSFVAAFGNRLLFLELGTFNSVTLCSFNQEMQLLEKKKMPQEFLRSRYHLMKTDSSLQFLFYFRFNDSMYMNLLEMDQALNLKPIKRSGFPLPDLRRSRYDLVTNEQQNYFLFYHVWVYNQDSAFLFGHLTNRNLDLKKEIAYTFSFKQELDTVSNLLLDSYGNIHLLVYDKPMNYRLSSNLNIHTVPFDSDEMITESFAFQKKKILGLLPLENRDKKQIQLGGLFLEGHLKNTEGVMHISMPVTRGNGLDYKLYAFQQMALQHLEKQSLRKPYRMLNGLKPSFIMREDGKLRLVAELPSFNYGYTDTTGNYQRSLSRLRFGEAATTNIEDLRRLNNLSQNQIVAPATTGAGRSNRSSRQTSSNNIPSFDASSMLNPNSNFREFRPTSPVKFRAISSRAPRYYSFNLSGQGDWLGYQQKGLDEFYNEVYNMHLPVQLGGEFYLVAYGASKDDTPFPVLIGYENDKPFLIPLTKDPKLEGIRFHQFQKISSNSYLGIYTKEQTDLLGVMVLSVPGKN